MLIDFLNKIFFYKNTIFLLIFARSRRRCSMTNVDCKGDSI